jgi:hypothetical protein
LTDPVGFYNNNGGITNFKIEKFNNTDNFFSTHFQEVSMVAPIYTLENREKTAKYRAYLTNKV